MTLGIFTFLACWNDYLWPLVAINDLGPVEKASSVFTFIASTFYFH